MTEKILIIFALFLVFSSLTFSQVFSETIHTFEYTKIGCDMLAIDQIQSVLEEKKWIKTTLAECVERGLITSELVELGATVWGHSTRELSIVYGLTHGDIEKTIQLLQDPNYPINVFGSPYKQVSIGIEPENVLCKDGLVLIQKYDNSPACVTESTKTKLIERGWTKDVMDYTNSHPCQKLAFEAFANTTLKRASNTDSDLSVGYGDGENEEFLRSIGCYENRKEWQTQEFLDYLNELLKNKTKFPQ